MVVVHESALAVLKTSAATNPPVVFVLRYNEHPNRKEIDALPTRLQRSDRVEAFYALRKQPIFDRLGKAPGVRVIDPLEGMAEMIVEAPAKTWLDLLNSGDPVLDSPKIDVIANRLVGQTL